MSLQKFLFFIGMLLAGINFLHAQPQQEYSLVERTDTNGFKEYFAYHKTQVDEEKEKASKMDQTLLEDWKKKATDWKAKYRSTYPISKPDKIKLKVLQSRISLGEADKFVQEMTLAEKETYAVIKMTNENGAMYEVMTENESALEYVKEIKFYLKEWQRYHDKKRKQKPPKPYFYLIKSGFKTKEEAKAELLRVLEE